MTWYLQNTKKCINTDKNPTNLIGNSPQLCMKTNQQSLLKKKCWTTFFSERFSKSIFQIFKRLQWSRIAVQSDSLQCLSPKQSSDFFGEFDFGMRLRSSYDTRRRHQQINFCRKRNQFGKTDTTGRNAVAWETENFRSDRHNDLHVDFLLYDTNVWSIKLCR